MINILIDLDNTLIDTEKIKQYFFQMALYHGLSLNQAKEIYYSSRDEKGKITITLKKWVEGLKNYLKNVNISFSPKIVEQEVENIKKDKNIVFLGVDKLVNFCRQKNFKYYLLSLGVPNWQKQKIHWFDLNKYFQEDNIIFTEQIIEGKVDVINKLFGPDFKGENSVIFNDKPKETEDVLNAFPDMIAFLKREEKDERYKEGDYIKLKEKFNGRLFFSKNLNDLVDIFINNYAKKQYKSSDIGSR